MNAERTVRGSKGITKKNSKNPDPPCSCCAPAAVSSIPVARRVGPPRRVNERPGAPGPPLRDAKTATEEAWLNGRAESM